MKKNLEVSMLGTFRMQYGNHSFIIDRKSTTKTKKAETAAAKSPIQPQKYEKFLNV